MSSIGSSFHGNGTNYSVQILKSQYGDFSVESKSQFDITIVGLIKKWQIMHKKEKMEFVNFVKSGTKMTSYKLKSYIVMK